MSKKNLYLLGTLFVVMLCLFLYPRKKPVPDVNLQKFEIVSNGFNYSCRENFNFLKGKQTHINPLSKKLTTGIEQLKAFLEANPCHRLTVTGYSCENEIKTKKDISPDSSLALARANDVKNYFISQGINPKILVTDGIVEDIIPSDTIFGSVSYKLEKDWTSVRDSLNANPLTAYFKAGASTTDLGLEDSTKIQLITTLLNKLPNANINIVAYADSTGSQSENLKLSEARTNFFKKYLLKVGIADNRIESHPKGTLEPIAPNNTPEGRAQNRRAVVLIN